MWNSYSDRARENAYRYYVLSIEPTLFEEMSLVREWGRIGCGARRTVELHPDVAAAKIGRETWLARKRRRGYELRERGYLTDRRR